MSSKLKTLKFFEQVKQEAKKVSWPEKKELTVSVMIVLVTVLIFGLATMMLDYAIHGLVNFILNIGK